ENELPARVAGFRLPVIQIQEVQEVPAAQVMLAGDFGEIRRERIRALVAEDRVPAVAVPELAEEAGRRAAHSEFGIPGVALIADALVVGARNAQCGEPEVAGVEIGSEDVLLLPREAERLIHQQGRGQRPRLTGRDLVHLRVSTAAANR